MAVPATRTVQDPFAMGNRPLNGDDGRVNLTQANDKGQAETKPVVDRFPAPATPKQVPATPTRNDLANEFQAKIKEDIDINAGYYIHSKKLGEGGFGKVKLATHLVTKADVAIKIIDKNKISKEDIPRIYNEIECLKRLRHENIAQLYQVIDTPSHLYLVQELCGGGELFDYICAKRRLTEGEARPIFRSLMKVIAYIHSMGFAHRDLKLENILLDKKGNVKLIDFGLAANCSFEKSHLSHLKTCCGSPAYAPPELLEGRTYSGPIADVWSAGVIFFCLLCGELPFDDSDLNKLYRKIKEGQFIIRPILTLHARDLIKRMLQVKPERRISVPEVLKHPWLNEDPKSPHALKGNESLGEKKLIDVLDDVTLWEVHKKFPNVPLNILKRSIINNFGYHTASYWLLFKHPPSPMKVDQENNIIRTPFRRRRSKSTSDAPGTSLAVSTPRTDQTPRTAVGSKRKTVEDATGSIPPKQPAPGDRTYQPKTAIPTPVRPPTTPVPRPPPMHTKFHTEKKRPAIPPRSSGQTSTPTPVGAHIRSPLRSLGQGEDIKSPTPNSKLVPKTPTTVKKSLFRRLLESATPSKSHSPRILQQSEVEGATWVPYRDPKECIESLLEVLKRKKIECKVKEFTIHCVFNHQFQPNAVSFQLEVCLFQNQLVLVRKRLRGDSWRFKKVWDEVLNMVNSSNGKLLKNSQEVERAVLATKS